MASNSSASSSSAPSYYPPNTGASRSGNSAISASSLYDDRKQADRAAVLQAFADPAVSQLMERMATSCKVKRRNGGKRWYCKSSSLQGSIDSNAMAMVEYQSTSRVYRMIRQSNNDVHTLRTGPGRRSCAGYMYSSLTYSDDIVSLS